MTPEDCLTPSQEATKLARQLLNCEQALRSERWFRKKDKEALDRLREDLSIAQQEVERRGEANRMHQRNYERARDQRDQAIKQRDTVEAKGTASLSEGSYHSKAYGGSE